MEISLNQFPVVNVLIDLIDPRHNKGTALELLQAL